MNQSMKSPYNCSNIILDTSNGAAITFMAAPGRALTALHAIRGEVLRTNMNSLRPLHLRMVIDQYVVCEQELDSAMPNEDLEKESLQMANLEETKTNWKSVATHFALTLPAIMTFAILFWTAPSLMWLFR